MGEGESIGVKSAPWCINMIIFYHCGKMLLKKCRVGLSQVCQNIVFLHLHLANGRIRNFFLGRQFLRDYWWRLRIEEGIVDMKVKLVNLGEMSFPQFLTLAIVAYRKPAAPVLPNCWVGIIRWLEGFSRYECIRIQICIFIIQII